MRRRIASVLAFSAILSACTGSGDPSDRPRETPPPTSASTSGSTPSPATAAEVEVIDVGRSPWGVAIGYGSVWVPTADSLVRVDADSGEVIATIELPASVAKGPTVRGDPLIFNWAATGAGGVWVAVARARLSVLHIDPTSEEVVDIIDVGRAPDAPTPLAVGAGGVWIANPATPTLTRIDPTAGEIVETIPLRGFAPVRASGIAVADGSVWVMDHNSGTVLRVDPETGKTTQRVQLDTSGRLSADGNTIWAASAGQDLLQSVDSDTGKPGPVIETCAGVNNVVATDTALWISTGTALVCVIDIGSEEQQVIDLPAGGGILAAAGSSAWVSLPTEGQVAHVSLTRPG